MPQIDVSHLGIRVILNDHFYITPMKNGPLDVEGTVLSIVTHHPRAANILREGSILELVCGSNYRGMADIFVRWDTDEKEWFSSGHFILRRAKIGFCVNIWNSHDPIKLDRRPYHELRPQYYSDPSSYRPKLFSKSTWEIEPQPIDKTVLYKSIDTIPSDGNWYKCEFRGVVSRARKVLEGFEVQEDSYAAPIQIVTLPNTTQNAPPRAPKQPYPGAYKAVLGAARRPGRSGHPGHPDRSKRGGHPAYPRKKLKKKKLTAMGEQYVLGKPTPPQGPSLHQQQTKYLEGNLHRNHSKGSYATYLNSFDTEAQELVVPKNYTWGDVNVKNEQIKNIQTIRECTKKLKAVSFDDVEETIKIPGEKNPFVTKLANDFDVAFEDLEDIDDDF